MRKLNKFQRIVAYMIGVVLSIGVIVGGFSVFQSMTGRAEDQVPRDVVISNTTSNSARIVWSTGTKNQGVVEYGTTPTSLNLFAPETEGTIDHKVDLTLLSSNATYYFDINIGGKKYDNAGVPWTFTTKGVNSVEGVNPSSSVLPSPISTVHIPNAGASTCTDTDCAIIKRKLGTGCSAQDYFKCLHKLTPTVSPTP